MHHHCDNHQCGSSKSNVMPAVKHCIRSSSHDEPFPIEGKVQSSWMSVEPVAPWFAVQHATHMTPTRIRYCIEWVGNLKITDKAFRI